MGRLLPNFCSTMAEKLQGRDYRFIYRTFIKILGYFLYFS